MINDISRIIRSGIRRIISKPMDSADVKKKYMYLGSEYGGWPLLANTRRGSLIYSFGVGEDISFDREAIRKFDCQVHAFDPTPKSRDWVAQQSLPSAFIFHAVGVAASDGDAEFAPPLNDTHVSFSAIKARVHGAGNAVTAPVRRIETLIAQLGAGEPQVIKMDIEGFEYEVITDMLASGIRPQQFLVEFHHGLYGFSKDDTRDSVMRLRSSGYELFYVSSSGREYAFCK